MLLYNIRTTYLFECFYICYMGRLFTKFSSCIIFSNYNSLKSSMKQSLYIYKNYNLYVFSFLTYIFHGPVSNGFRQIHLYSRYIFLNICMLMLIMLSKHGSRSWTSGSMMLCPRPCWFMMLFLKTGRKTSSNGRILCLMFILRLALYLVYYSLLSHDAFHVKYDHELRIAARIIIGNNLTWLLVWISFRC